MDPKRLTYLLAALFIPCAILVCIFRCGLAPRMHPGDKMESRTCRQCDLRKVRPDCVTCGGDGKVDVIIPGPNRPTAVTFDIFDKVIRKPDVPGFEFKWIPMPGNNPFRSPMPGALPGADLIITGPNGFKKETKTTSIGTWTEALKPGAYTLSVNASGYKPVIRPFTVPVMTGVVWLEDARLDDSDVSEYYQKSPKERPAVTETILEVGLIR